MLFVAHIRLCVIPLSQMSWPCAVWSIFQLFQMWLLCESFIGLELRFILAVTCQSLEDINFQFLLANFHNDLRTVVRVSLLHICQTSSIHHLKPKQKTHS